MAADSAFQSYLQGALEGLRATDLREVRPESKLERATEREFVELRPATVA